MNEKERAEALALLNGEPLDLDDLKWDFRALGCDVTEPRWREDRYADDGGDWIMDVTAGSLRITIYHDRTVHLDSDCDLLWADSIEWKALHLVMRKVGALAGVEVHGKAE